MSVPYAPPTGQLPPHTPAGGSLRRLFGVLLVLPAFALLIWSYVWPTAWTIWKSFQRVSAFGTAPDRPVGLANYQEAFQQGFWGSVGFALTLAAVPLLVVAVAAPALAWAAHRTGTAARWVVRVALALPLAAYAPTAIAAGWVASLRGSAHPVDLAAIVRSVAWSGTFGLGCAVAVTAYLAALRRRDPRLKVWPAMTVVGILLALAAIALALQEFTYSYIFGGSGRHGTATPMLLAYLNNFSLARFGNGAAAATLLLIPLAALGIAATVLMIASRLRIEVDPAYRSADESTGWPPARVVAVVATVLLLAIVLVVTAYGLWPWLSRLGDTTPGTTSAGQAVVNTWIPTLFSTVVGVTVALLAAVGIGALRPLGRRSELLLLPFAPWLFVGTGPLLAPAFTRAAHTGQLGTLLGLVSPTWVAIPVLFVATLLFRGQEARLRAGVPDAGAIARTLVLPALPMLPILFGAVWIWQSQDLLWQLAVSTPQRPTAPVAAIFGAGELFSRDTGIGLILPALLLVVFVLAAIAAQLAYFDRLAVRVGREDADEPVLQPADHQLPTATDLGYRQDA